MMQIPISNIPNQSFTLQIDDSTYLISLMACDNDVMSVDISRDDQLLITGQILIPSYPIIPYKYLATGNFILTTNNQDLADYTQFGISQFLIYASQTEIEAILAVPIPLGVDNGGD